MSAQTASNLRAPSISRTCSSLTQRSLAPSKLPNLPEVHHVFPSPTAVNDSHCQHPLTFPAVFRNSLTLSVLLVQSRIQPSGLKGRGVLGWGTQTQHDHHGSQVRRKLSQTSHLSETVNDSHRQHPLTFLRPPQSQQQRSGLQGRRAPVWGAQNQHHPKGPEVRRIESKPTHVHPRAQSVNRSHRQYPLTPNCHCFQC